MNIEELSIKLLKVSSMRLFFLITFEVKKCLDTPNQLYEYFK